MAFGRQFVCYLRIRLAKSDRRKAVGGTELATTTARRIKTIARALGSRRAAPSSLTQHKLNFPLGPLCSCLFVCDRYCLYHYCSFVTGRSDRGLACPPTLLATIFTPSPHVLALSLLPFYLFFVCALWIHSCWRFRPRWIFEGSPVHVSGETFCCRELACRFAVAVLRRRAHRHWHCHERRCLIVALESFLSSLRHWNLHPTHLYPFKHVLSSR